MSQLITCVGELLIDFLPIVEDGRTVGFRMHPGGSVMNVAVTAARLDQPVAFASKVSTDMFGRELRAFVESQGVDTRFLLDSPAQSTLAFVSMAGGEAAYNFYTTGTADTLLTIDEFPPALFDETRILHFGSISLLRGTTPAAALAAAERLKGRALLSIDPNLRPNLIEDESAYRATLDRAMRLADIIKISEADLGWLMPGATLDGAAAALMTHGAALVIVTRGGSGVLALHRTSGGETRAITLPAFPITLVDTVGAGDSYSGGLLAALAARNIVTRDALESLAEADLVAALRFAAAVAALTCTRPGADPPRLAEVEEFLADHPDRDARES
jgi:fructokinase